MKQIEALSILKTGANVFLTGAPGAGKTYVLNQYIDYLRRHDIGVAVTASTGIAATHIGGITIHSWSGMGIKRELNEKELDQLTQRSYLHKRFDSTSVLIIDEISMLDGQTLDTLDTVCKRMRRSADPFGGLQVVLVGDFFQLPPINKENGEATFAFQSNAWQNSNLLVCYLDEQHRQEDSELLGLLDSMRSGDPEEQAGILEDRLHAEFDETVSVTKLYTHNADVDALNLQKLAELPGESESFFIDSTGKKNMVERLVKSCLSPEVLELKIGAVVMCTKNNFEEGYVNGTLGEVIDFDTESGYPVIVTNGGDEIVIKPATWEINDGEKTLAAITQVPLRLAWAITVHKSQGMSLDAAEIDLGKAFEYGQGYVALSRVRTLGGLRLLGFSHQALLVHPRVMEHDQKFKNTSTQIQDYHSGKDPDFMQERHEAFITQAGGSLEEIDYESAKVKKAKEKKTPTAELTRLLVVQEKSIHDIAEERGLTPETIVGHIEDCIEKGTLTLGEISYIRNGNKHLEPIIEVFQEVYDETGELHLSPVKSKMGANTSFFDIRVGRLFVGR